MSEVDQPQKDETRARKKEEFNLASRFINAANRKLDQITLRDTNFQLDKAESKVLMEVNNTGLLEGAAAGILSFIVLRRIRSGFLHRLRQQTATNSPVPYARKSPFQQQKPPLQAAEPSADQPLGTIAEGVLNRRSSAGSGTVFNVLSWMIDFTVSFYIAVYVSLRNPDKILQKVSAIPLIEGRSRVAEELCPEFMRELRSIQEDRDSGALNSIQSNALQNPQTPILKALLLFCHNCQRRATYEKLLRQERGLAPDAAVSIPSPGVPHNEIPTAINPIGNNTAWGDEPQGPDFYDPSLDNAEAANNNEWTESFVTDQEDQAKNERGREK